MNRKNSLVENCNFDIDYKNNSPIHPDRVAACMEDLRSGRLQAEVLSAAGSREYFTIPHQTMCSEFDSFVTYSSPFVFSTELRERMEAAKGRVLYVVREYDQELLECSFLKVFSVNHELEIEALSGISDGLVIEMVENFDALVAMAFVQIFVINAGYETRFQDRENPLAGLTEALFQGAGDGENAETFRAIFPAPECLPAIINNLEQWGYTGRPD